jgi:hypothetical protein
MPAVRQHTPQASGKSSIAQMLAQKSQPPAMAAAPPRPPLNGLRAPAPPLPAPTAGPPLAGATGQAIVPQVLKQAMLNQIYGRGAGGPQGGPVGR